MTPFPTLSTLFLFLAFTGSSGAGLPLSSEIDSEILDTILHKSKYDAAVRPAGLDLNKTKTSPVVVAFQLMIRQINFLDDIKQEVSTQLTLRLSWQDPRHRYEHIFNHSPDTATRLPDYVVIAESSRIWNPDIFILNEKSSFIHNVLRPNVLVRIFKNGTTYLSTRITVVTSCPMDLHWYPFDKHDCPVTFEFYALKENEATLTWSDRESLEVLTGNELPLFQLHGVYQAGGILFERILSGNFSSIRAHLQFERRLSYYLFTVYLPCFLLCAVSWTSFWFDVRAIGARVSLGITTILATATQLNGIAEGSPTVSYLKAVDIFSCLCQLFVTAAFLEFATVSFIVRNGFKRGEDQINRKGCTDYEPLNERDGFQPWAYYRKRHPRVSGENPKIKTSESQNWDMVDVRIHIGVQIDKICRIAFPSLFFGFAVVYFSVCLQH